MNFKLIPFLLIALVSCTNVVDSSDRQSTPKGDGGYDHGNGGDGIVLEDGSVQLFDLWERKVTESPDASDDYDTSALAHAVPRSTFFDDSLTLLHVQRFLYTTARFAPATFVRAFLRELNLVQWNRAAKDLAPNPDTKPWLDLTGVNRIGCARHLNAQILVSPSCYGPKMVPVQKAALVFHEIIYRLYKKEHPEIQNSFDVRTVVATLFSRETVTSIRTVLSNNGFKHILEEAAPEEALFETKGSEEEMKWLRCKAINSDAYIAQLTLHIEYPYLVLGKFQLSENKNKVLTFKNIGNNLFEHSDFEASLPVFDTTTHSMQFELTSNGVMYEKPTTVSFSYSDLIVEVKTPGYSRLSCEFINHSRWTIEVASTWLSPTP